MAKTPGTIMGVKSKWAVVIVLVVFVGVWYYLKHRSSGIATQTQTTGQVAATGQQDTTGGVAQSPDLSSLFDLFAQQNAAISDLSSSVGALANAGSGYYSAPSTPPSTTSYTYNYTGASPPTQQGQVNSPAPVPSTADPFGSSFFVGPSVGTLAPTPAGLGLASGVAGGFSFPATTTVPSIGPVKVGSNFTVNPVTLASKQTKSIAQ